MSVLANIGNSSAEIANIQRQLRKFKETSSFEDKAKTGRPTKWTDEIEKQVTAWTEEDRRHTTTKLSKMVLEWPSQSPDLNPIELLWEDMDREIKKEKPTSLAGLEEVTRQVWSEISQEKLNKLIDRLLRLCQAVIEAEGDILMKRITPQVQKQKKVYP